MTLLDQIKADREAGTPGPWMLKNKGGDTCLYMDGSCEMCDMTYYPWTPENYTDWIRIARVPDMEAALLAAGKLADAVEPFLDAIHALTGGNVDDMRAKLAAFRGAIEVK